MLVTIITAPLVALMVYCPLASAETPLLEPLTLMEADTTGSPVAASVILPVTLISCAFIAVKVATGARALTFS